MLKTFPGVALIRDSNRLRLRALVNGICWVAVAHGERQSTARYVGCFPTPRNS
jgi:hypothetical protein